MPGRIDIETLKRLVSDGDIDTIIAAFPDMYGRLVGKRVEGRRDLALGETAQRRELCEGALLRSLGIVVDHIELGAVAGGERHRLSLPAREPAHELRVLRCAHEEPLPKLDGRPVM